MVFFKGRLAAIHPATEQAAEFSRRAARRDLEVEISSDVACVLKKEKSNEQNKERKFFGGLETPENKATRTYGFYSSASISGIPVILTR